MYLDMVTEEILGKFAAAAQRELSLITKDPRHATGEAVDAFVRAALASFQSNRTDIAEALRALATFNPKSVPAQFDPKSGANPYYDKTALRRKELRDELAQDSQQPFFSELYLYNLLGKEDARTLLARFNRLVWLLGIDDRDIYGVEEADEGQG